VAERLASAAVPVTTLALADVRGGVLDRIFRARAEAGNRAIVCDAVTDVDLAAIAAAGAMLEAAVVWVGSGGLARRLFTDSNPSRHQMQISHPIPSGPVLVVAGSLTAITGSQAASVAAAGARPVTVSAEDLSTRSRALERNRNEIERHLRAGMDVVVGIGRRHTATAADTALVDHLARMLKSCQSLVGGVVATGGDTAAALLKQWGIGGLRLIGEVETGVPIGLAIGPRPLIVALKAGGFGHDATLALARTAVRSFLRCSLAP
jgi:uncharacterized protein YgbK (DUF1537 family)